MDLKLEFVFEANCQLAHPVELGKTPSGLRRIVDITSGDFEGPGICGTLLPGGADWQVVRPDGVTELLAHYILRTDDGVLIQMRNRGLRHGPPEVMRRLAAGEPVDDSEYYCRTTPVFEAPEGKYEWMNRSIFVGTAARYPDSIKLHFYRVA